MTLSFLKKKELEQVSSKYINFIIAICLLIIAVAVNNIYELRSHSHYNVLISFFNNQRILVEDYSKNILLIQSFKSEERLDYIRNLEDKMLASNKTILNGGTYKTHKKKLKYIIPKSLNSSIRNSLIKQHRLLLEYIKFAKGIIKDPNDQYNTNQFLKMGDKISTNIEESLYLIEIHQQEKLNNSVFLESILLLNFLFFSLLVLAQILMINRDLENKNMLLNEKKKELKQLNDHLEETIKERTAFAEDKAKKLEESNKELEQFAFITSHDLQEPLRKIISFGDLLTTKYNNNLDEKGKSYIEYMTNAASRMRSLIQDVLELSRVSTKDQHIEEVNLNHIINEIISDMDLIIKEKKAQIIFQDLPTITGDKRQIYLLIQNLISNSIKYRKKDTSPIIHIHSRIKSNNEIELTVADNGIGFDKQQAEKIFIMFQRLHAKEEYEGTGIGLAICKKIASRHGGEIFASSEKDQGATFTVRLPCQIKKGSHYVNNS